MFKLCYSELSSVRRANAPYLSTPDEPDHIVDISATAVYDRMVKAHKGGYCMQHATLVLNILRELGYIA